MPSRRLPISDEGRLRALNAGKTKNDSIPLPNQFLTANTKSRLNAMQLQFQTAMQNRSNALAAQGGSTATVNTAFENGRNHVSHFIQVFNFGVTRNVYPAAHRAYYTLDIGNDRLPQLKTEADVTTWGMRISAGDAARIAAGGTAMSNPTVTDVAAALTAFNTANTSQSGLKDAYDDAQEAVEALREEADKVIKKVWDEVETFFNEETPASKRRNSREWGVVYLSDIDLTFNFTVTDSVTNAPIASVIIDLEETGNTITTDAAGAGQMISKISDECNFKFTHPDYVVQEVNVLLPTGTTVFAVNVALVHI
jgi:hypothetical protein